MPEVANPSEQQNELAKLTIAGEEIDIPVVKGSENEIALDIGSLRKSSGYITIDPGYVNTGSTTSGITFLNGEEGVLRYPRLSD